MNITKEQIKEWLLKLSDVTEEGDFEWLLNLVHDCIQGLGLNASLFDDIAAAHENDDLEQDECYLWLSPTRKSVVVIRTDHLYELESSCCYYFEDDLIGCLYGPLPEPPE